MSAVFGCIDNHFILMKEQAEHASSHRQRIFGELLKQILISQWKWVHFPGATFLPGTDQPSVL